jgi:hypothetical protein
MYVLRTEPIRFPSAGLHRNHHAAVKGGSGGNILSGTAAGELIVISEAGRLFRASLPVTSNGMLSLLAIGDDVYDTPPPPPYARARINSGFPHQMHVLSRCRPRVERAAPGTQAVATAALSDCRGRICTGRQQARRWWREKSRLWRQLCRAITCSRAQTQAACTRS